MSHSRLLLGAHVVAGEEGGGGVQAEAGGQGPGPLRLVTVISSVN